MKDLGNESLQYPYNLIITDKFLFMVLRKCEKAEDVLAINAMGFTGSFMLKNETQMQLIEKLTPIQIMSSVCI